MQNPVKSEAVERAVSALLKWRVKHSQTMKLQLLEDDEMLYLILTLNNIPVKTQTKPIRLPVPHPIYYPATDASEVCLIYDDRPKSVVTKEFVKKKVEEDKIPIAKVIRLSKLKSDYRPFESKRKLCGSYDVFLADKRVIPLLPKMLGKQFFKSRKIPVAVNLEHHNWKEQVESACGSALLFLRTGTCCVVKVGKISMGENHLVENVIAAIDHACKHVSVVGGDVRALHLKLSESLALPIFQALPDMKYTIDSLKEAEGEVTEEDSRKAEKIKKKSKKRGRISDDVNLDEKRQNLEEESAQLKKVSKKGIRKGRICDVAYLEDCKSLDSSDSKGKEQNTAEEKPAAVKKSGKKDLKRRRNGNDTYEEENKPASELGEKKQVQGKKVSKKSKKGEMINGDCYGSMKKDDVTEEKPAQFEKVAKESKKKGKANDDSKVKCDDVICEEEGTAKKKKKRGRVSEVVSLEGGKKVESANIEGDKLVSVKKSAKKVKSADVAEDKQAVVEKFTKKVESADLGEDKQVVKKSATKSKKKGMNEDTDSIKLDEIGEKSNSLEQKSNEKKPDRKKVNSDESTRYSGVHHQESRKKDKSAKRQSSKVNT